MVRARWITRRRTDAAILLADQRIVVERLVRRVTPELAAHALMQALGECLGEAIGERFEKDRRIVVVVALEAREMSLNADTGRDRERAGPVGDACRFRCDEVGEAEIG